VSEAGKDNLRKGEGDARHAESWDCVLIISHIIRLYLHRVQINCDCVIIIIMIKPA